jgi:hypothetical protein
MLDSIFLLNNAELLFLCRIYLYNASVCNAEMQHEKHEKKLLQIRVRSSSKIVN